MTAPTIVIQLVTTEEELLKTMHRIFEQKAQELHSAKKEQPEREGDELLTIAQVSKYFSVSVTTIHSWKNSGILPYLKMKSRIRFRKSEILSFDSRLRKKNRR